MTPPCPEKKKPGTSPGTIFNLADDSGGDKFTAKPFDLGRQGFRPNLRPVPPATRLVTSRKRERRFPPCCRRSRFRLVTRLGSYLRGGSSVSARIDRQRKVPEEPLPCQASHCFQGALLREEVSGAGNDHQFRRTPEPGQGLLVQFDHDIVGAADDEQGRRLDRGQLIPGEVGPSAARND